VPRTGRPDAGLVQVDAAGAGDPDPGGQRQLIEGTVLEETDVDAVNGRAEPLRHAGQAADDLGEVLQAAAAAQFSGVMHGGLEAQDVLAFGVGLELEQPEADPEPGQAILRFLDHGFLRGGPGRTVAVRPVLQAEQGPQRGDVQPGPGPVQDPVKQVLHLATGAKQQVAAVFGLVDGVAVAEPAAGLVSQVQAEAQAGSVDPPVADPAQAPYSRRLRQGICDLGQAWAVTAARAGASGSAADGRNRAAREGAGRELQLKAWRWAQANRAGDGFDALRPDIGRRHGRHERWGRLVKRSGMAGELNT